MYNTGFWTSIRTILSSGITSEDLATLDVYADRFISGKLLYQRFSPAEQHGCAAGGYAHVIATILAGAEAGSNSFTEGRDEFKRQCERAEAQAHNIEMWARAALCWHDNIDQEMSSLLGDQIAEGGEAHVYDHGSSLIKTIGLDYYVEPILALDRISLHNAIFPETRMKVLGFGKDEEGAFKILVEQPYIAGSHMSEDEIADFVQHLGFRLVNPRNWTYATPEIYLSDMHDENVIRSAQGNVYVIDCDIRINTPELKCGGVRALSTEVIFKE